MTTFENSNLDGNWKLQQAEYALGKFESNCTQSPRNVSFENSILLHSCHMSNYSIHLNEATFIDANFDRFHSQLSNI